MERRRAPRLKRLLAASLLAALGCSGDSDRELRAAELGVFVLVVDGLMPSEIGALTPNLVAFRDEGTWWEESRSVMIAETIPNHMAMMTGVYPDRSDIPANTRVRSHARERPIGVTSARARRSSSTLLRGPG